MSTTLLSAFYDINDFLCNKNEKSLNNYNNFNSMLDKKAVGTPVTSFAPGFLRRHSTSNLQALANSSSSKYPSSSFPNIKESNNTAMLNKENKFRDRSFSESAERLHQQQHPPLSPLHLVQQQQQQKQPGGGGGGQVNSTRYKTELCRPFEESGTCKYGDKCQFAHGMHELRSLTRHPKYKTELCRTFHTIGFCPYGPRCHFIHNAEERRQAPTNNNAVNSFHHQQQQHHSRPKLHHSLSFSGFPSASSGLESPLLESPTSRTPPPPCSSSSSSAAAASSFVFCDELLSPTLPACANNAFTFSSQELSNLLTPLAIQTQQLPGGTGGYGQQQSANGCPPSPPFLLSHVQSCLRRLADSPVFDAPPSPPDSLSDRESYLSGSLSSGSLSGSESPSMDPGRRLPIFSRLSISED